MIKVPVLKAFDFTKIFGWLTLNEVEFGPVDNLRLYPALRIQGGRSELVAVSHVSNPITIEGPCDHVVGRGWTLNHQEGDAWICRNLRSSDLSHPPEEKDWNYRYSFCPLCGSSLVVPVGFRSLADFLKESQEDGG